MSGLDGLQLDADGYLDMSQFPDDGTDLAGPELDQLREVLHSDPVEEPTDQQWDAMFDDVVTADDSGPFALDDVEGLVVDADGSTPDADVALDTDDVDPDTGADVDDVDTSVDGFDADDGLDLDIPIDDLDLDLDGGLDLAAADAVDDGFSTDGLDDAPADIANNDFEDLL